ncbi:SGNH/GDSL hydrolase family protein [Rhodococcus sp. SGAir0479]|uniref:SGNH/GDSL hydrolase family protein n=1 Tax=Rhodococcus sp. SGAir0479 TaxID=2567884 RepID=UPI0010CCB99A|nr:SGNH/GDSL hydrolase family protein [Rhodococcus sp. SGAir0479]QCQ91729.1 SGNH/GDSL hydrolase family protein [Rhodococcus sp. SGAir0479]
MSKKERSQTAGVRDRKTVAFWSVMAVAIVAALVMYGISVVREGSPDEAYASTYVPATTEVVAPVMPKNQIADVMGRLNDPSHAFQIVVLGDSTGVARRGWVVQLGEALGAKTGRLVTLNPWSVEQEPDGYIPPWRLANGSQPAVTIWNGSASGTKSVYAHSNLNQIVPIDGSAVDLVLVNYGHNEETGGLVGYAGPLMADMIKRFPNAAIVGVLQNPERPGSAHEQMHDINIEAFRTYLQGRNDPMIDVYTPYKAMPGWENAFEDKGDLHPSQAGYDLWASVVRQALGV